MRRITSSLSFLVGCSLLLQGSLVAAQPKRAPAKPAKTANKKTAKTAKPSTPEAPAKDGTYASTEDNYRAAIKFDDDTLVVTESNKSSTYKRRGDTSIYEYTDPERKVTFVLEIVGDGLLKSYKLKSPIAFTLLRLVPAVPAAPAPAACQGVVTIPVQNEAAVNPNKEELWGALAIPGMNVTGTYTTDGASPVVVLGRDGKGRFEMHGAPKPEFVYQIRWWLQANCDGTLIKQDHPQAEVYSLIVEYVDKPYQGMKFDRIGLIAQKPAGGKLFIYDRAKPK